MYRFGDLLRQFRVREGMKQQELAKELGVHRQTIGAWERSQYLPATREDVEALAQVLYLNEEDTNALLIAADLPPKYYAAKADPPIPKATQPPRDMVDMQPAALVQHYPEKISISRLPETEPFLFERERQIQQLYEAWDLSTVNFVIMVSSGGMGKTALINHWLMRMSLDGYREAQRVFAWSFSPQRGLSSVEQFIDVALKWFDDPLSRQGSPREKGERLAQRLGKKRNLLVIDGLEAVLSPSRNHEGTVKDQALSVFLRELAANNRGLCLISTRCPIADLHQFDGNTCLSLPFPPLSTQAGTQLLRSRGIKGDQAQLEQVVLEFGGHPLALSLISRGLRDVYNGDINFYKKVNIDREDTYEGGRIEQMMRFYEGWFGEGPELEMLRLLSLFCYPVNKKEFIALRLGPMLPNLTTTLKDLAEFEWQRVLSKLQQANLVIQRGSDQDCAVQLHPLAYGYFKRNCEQTFARIWSEHDTTP
jgi:transcriptional regulator with XRE-family HTH domain